MPVYNATSPVLSCALGEKVSVWSVETPAVGVTGAGSIPVALTPLQGRQGFSVSGVFAGDPGGAQIDVQGTSNNSSDTNWSLIGTVTTYDPVNFTWNFFSTSTPPFVRLYMRNRINAVAVGAIISRY